MRLAQVDKAVIGCFSEGATFQRLGLVRFHCMTFYWTVNYVDSTCLCSCLCDLSAKWPM